MFEAIRAFLYDQKVFRRTMRSVLGTVGVIYLTLGYLPTTREQWIGAAGVAVAWFMKSGLAPKDNEASPTPARKENP